MGSIAGRSRCGIPVDGERGEGQGYPFAFPGPGVGSASEAGRCRRAEASVHCEEQMACCMMTIEAHESCLVWTVCEDLRLV